MAAQVWSQAFGVANLDRELNCTPETIFPIASVTKAVSAVAIMMLWERGLVQLDSDVSQYLPFPVINPKFPDSPITIRHILTHSSSLRDSKVIIMG